MWTHVRAVLGTNWTGLRCCKRFRAPRSIWSVGARTLPIDSALVTDPKGSHRAQSQLSSQSPDRVLRRRPSLRPPLRTKRPHDGMQPGARPWQWMVTRATNTAQRGQPIPIWHANKAHRCPIRAVFISESRSSPVSLCKTSVEWLRCLAGGETRTN